MKLNSTALSKNTATSIFKTAFAGVLRFRVEGDLSGETITLQESNDATAANFDDYASQGTEVTLDAADGSTTDGVNVDLPGGKYYRWLMSNGAGTPANVYVHADGPNIRFQV